ncbi:MAG: CopD family protein [Nitrospirales bacterium]|nr:CopD family protein [Nitrospirales bacterium]
MKRQLLTLMLPLFALLFFAPPSQATVEYAKQTRLECRDCHVEVVGGGALTPRGKAFLAERKAKGLSRQMSTTQRVIRLIVGYLHLMSAITWFGAILYVHILLKPAYASKGLPKGELRLGWLSMIIVSFSGTLLTIARIPSLEMFYTTRFGILLAIKIFLFLVMLSSAAVVTFFVGPRMKRKQCASLSNGPGDCSSGQLSHYDGLEGRPTCFAYKGVIYDASQSALWKGGLHMRKHTAGHDLTDALKNAPHGEEKVLALPVFGNLLSMEEARKKPLFLRAFYFMAYMNLSLTFVIIFVISLWRWW